MSKLFPRRFTQCSALEAFRDPELRERSELQKEMAELYYHILCAALQRKFRITDVPPDPRAFQVFPRSGIVFDSYTKFELEPITGLKLIEEGCLPAYKLKEYARWLRINWKCRQGGVLYCVDQGAEFWNLVLNWHSEDATTGIKAWDRLFKLLKETNYDKSTIPCMFFATERGCLVSRCPYMHNKEACIRDRERLFVKRRVKLGRPTPVDRKDIGEVLEKRKKAQNSSDLADSMGALALQEDESDWEDDEEPERGITGKDVRRACANPDCKLLQLKDGTDGQGHVVAMKRCSRCTVVAYCSRDCQVTDWKRHKAEPCRPYEELLENDRLWDAFGERLGTNMMIAVGNEDDPFP